MPQWTVSGPEKITFDEPVSALQVRTVAGAVHVVATDGPARLEVSEIAGPPLVVTLEDGTLTVTYEDLAWRDFSWKNVASYIDSWRRKRHAVVSLAVPADARVELGTVSADSVVSGIAGRVTVRGASGDTTLVRVSGPVEAHSVSGGIDAQSVSGNLRAQTVSGELTVVESSAPRLHANSVSGAITIDLNGQGPADVHLKTVSGEVAVQVPDPADTKVEAGTSSGRVSSAFDELRMGSTWGAKRLSGRLGAGTGTLQVTTVSGSVALLRRPPIAEDTAPEGTAPEATAPEGTAPEGTAPRLDLTKDGDEA
ncbi:DUF4097 family beta strand repeat-containing protein [Peterkaempfera bronchialis]|uniref:DUF4097 domain-containing protein n=1 Tax=Peterkaempfera bronchialis TaxID=2126346 RepID=A0A345T0A7_9ACTN|nr:DUF4097 family beta strand repeat-containing protein [Peterkaempfera bronchialis]AXI79412.1 hypothetical protein C7M71_020375 [Peterkaempfera bronchialis]